MQKQLRDRMAEVADRGAEIAALNAKITDIKSEIVYKDLENQVCSCTCAPGVDSCKLAKVLFYTRTCVLMPSLCRGTLLGSKCSTTLRGGKHNYDGSGGKPIQLPGIYGAESFVEHLLTGACRRARTCIFYASTFDRWGLVIISF
jgi:hypothetical protein